MSQKIGEKSTNFKIEGTRSKSQCWGWKHVEKWVMRERKGIRRTESGMFCVQELMSQKWDQLLKKRLNVEKQKENKQMFEKKKLEVHQTKELLKKEQYIKKLQGL